jgi:SAM-dependent methyltransferase
VTWDGDEYQRRFDALADSGVDVHGEASFVAGYAPRTVLDAGCGTGRVASELARRGIEVVGVDLDVSMLATCRERNPTIQCIAADLAALDLERTFDIVVMAGNVPLFTAPGTHAALVAGCERHVAPGGALVAGFQLGKSYSLADYDSHCAAAGLHLAERYATWDREPYVDGGDYAVSVHRRDAGQEPPLRPVVAVGAVTQDLNRRKKAAMPEPVKSTRCRTTAPSPDLRRHVAPGPAHPRLPDRASALAVIGNQAAQRGAHRLAATRRTRRRNGHGGQGGLWMWRFARRGDAVDERPALALVRARPEPTVRR